MKKKTNNQKRTYTQDGYFHMSDADAKVGFADLKGHWPFDDSKRIKREIDNLKESNHG